MTDLHTGTTTRAAVVAAITAGLTEVLGQDPGPFDERTSLFDEIGLDSTGVLDLLMSLEDRLGVEFDANDLALEHFATIGSLTTYVESLLGS